MLKNRKIHWARFLFELTVIGLCFYFWYIVIRICVSITH